MQLFINNWSAVLTAPAAVSAVQLSVDPAMAARLVGLGAGDYCLVTLAAVDAGGIETAHEVVKVTAVAGGLLTVERAQEGTVAADWPAAASVSARVTKGTFERLRDASGGAGGAGSEFLTGANFTDQARKGALGIQSPIAVFARDNIGACIITAPYGSPISLLPWITTTLTKDITAAGPYIFSSNAANGLLRDGNGLLALSTGAATGNECAAQISVGVRVSDASKIVSGSFVRAVVRPSDLSSGAQAYSLEVTLSLPPYYGVRFCYGADYSSSAWTIFWNDETGTEQSFVTSTALSVAALTYLDIQVSGGNLLCKIGLVTVHTIPLTGLGKDEASDVNFGVNVSVYKTAGATPVLVGLGYPAGQLMLTTV